MKKVHFISGVVLSIFITLHLINHLFAISSIERHIEVMNIFRLFYQNPFVEIVLIVAVLTQIVSGIQLVKNRGWRQEELFNKLHVYSGIFLGFFLLVHTSAVLVGRFILLVDTNFYYAAMVVNVKPYLFFYIPYYFGGVLSFFVHIACIMRIKTMRKVGQEKASKRANVVIGFGVVLAVIILVGFTYNVTLPEEYQDLIDHYIERVMGW